MELVLMLIKLITALAIVALSLGVVTLLGLCVMILLRLKP